MAERDNLSADWQEPSSTTERSADEIRQDIAARRESISETVDRLSDRFQRTFDWRAYVSDYPLVAVGVAAGLGFLTVMMFRPRQSPGERIKNALADGFEDVTDRFRNQFEDFSPDRSRSGLGSTVKAAATGLITKAVTDYLRNRLVGGYEQYNEYAPDYTAGYRAGGPARSAEHS